MIHPGSIWLCNILKGLSDYALKATLSFAHVFLSTNMVPPLGYYFFYNLTWKGFEKEHRTLFPNWNYVLRLRRVRVKIKLQESTHKGAIKPLLTRSTLWIINMFTEEGGGCHLSELHIICIAKKHYFKFIRYSVVYSKRRKKRRIQSSVRANASLRTRHWSSVVLGYFHVCRL